MFYHMIACFNAGNNIVTLPATTIVLVFLYILVLCFSFSVCAMSNVPLKPNQMTLLPSAIPD